MTPEQAQRAVYIDFEGRTKEDPVLLGVHYLTGRAFRTQVQMHYVIDPMFSTFVQATTSVPGLQRYDARLATPRRVMNEVVRLARSKDRLLVSWSTHEWRKVADIGLRGAIAREWTSRYRDGKATAKVWRNRLYHDAELPRSASGRRHTLANYMNLVDYALPDATYGPGRTGTNLGELRKAVERRGAWEHLTTRQQGRWVEVLHHNLHDCVGLRAIVTRASIELAESRAVRLG